MNFNDRPQFARKLKELAKVVGRTLDDETVKAYFNQLEEFPIDLLTRAMDKALQDRDPSDIFYKNALVTVPEIRAAIEEMAQPEEGQVGTVASCPICNGTAWIMGQDNEKRAIAWPCKCLYTVCKESLDNKMSAANAHRRRIIKAYEFHQKKWGGINVPEGE